MVETFIIMIVTLLIIPYSLTTRLLTIFWVTKANLSIFNPKYLIARIVITLVPTPLSTDTSCNGDPQHFT
jgi:hypothetical protein